MFFSINVDEKNQASCPSSSQHITGDFAEPVLISSTGYLGGAGNYLGASLGAGGYGGGNVGH